MRGLPETIRNPEYSTIQLTATDYGMSDAYFEGAVINYGDGEAFAWIAGGGLEKYRVRRVGSGNAIDDGTECSVWLIEILDNEDTLVESMLMDCPNHSITDIFGEPVRFELVNKTVDVVLDLFEENQVLRQKQKITILPGNVIAPNLHYVDIAKEDICNDEHGND